MNPLATGGRSLLLIAMLLVGMAGGIAPSIAAQSADVEPDFHVSELSDLEIEISGNDFEIYEAELQTYDHGEGEIIQISSTSAYIQVSFYDDTDTNLDTLEIYNDAFSADVDEFEILDEGESRSVVYTYALAHYNDVDFFYYTSVTEDVVGNVDFLQRIYAPDTTFFDDLSDAQRSIEIGGESFLGDIDVDDLEAAAGVTSGRDVDVEGDPTEEPVRDEPTEEEGSTRGRSTGDADHEFELVPAELTVSGDVSVFDTFYEEPVVEQVQLELERTEATAIIQVMQTPMDAEATLDLILGSFDSTLDSIDNLGSDADATSAWSLDVGEADGQESVIFVYVDGERYDGFHYVEVIFAPQETLLEDMDAFNQDAVVDGEGMFSDADVEELDALLSGGVRSDGPEDPDEEEAERSRQRTETKIGRDDEEEEVEERVRDRDRTSPEAPDENPNGVDLESQGLVSGSEFESLQHGVVVEWDDAVWSVDTTWELSAVSDTTAEVDSIILFWLDGSASMMIQIMPASDGVPSDFVALWESDDYVAESVHEDAEVLLADSGRNSGSVVYLTFDDEGQELILVHEVIDIDGGDTVGIITMFGSPDQIADAYADAEDLITVDESDAVGTFTPREINTVMEP